MAESQRKVDEVKVATDDDAQRARDRRNLVIMFVGGALLVVAMIFISKFLSGQ